MKTKPKKLKSILIVILSSATLLGIGVAGMQTLASMQTAPVKKPITEKALQVEVMKAELESVTPFITGFGEVKAVDVVPISAEIQGKVVEIYPRLEVGELIKRNEVLIRIDTSQEIIALGSNRKRYSALVRNLKLAKNEYTRLDKLNKKNRLVTVSEVEKAEQAYHSMVDNVSQLEHAIASSKLRIDRATIHSPFAGRIKEVFIEKGQFVTPGTTVITLVDDSVLEVIVSIDGTRAEKILKFKNKARADRQFWFKELEQVPVLISWPQGDAHSNIWGILHRVVAFDSKNRTLKLAVRLTISEDVELADFPIVEGMFCQVKIPGNTMQNVIRLPRQAVQYDKTVHVVSDNRLRTVPVKIGWMEEEYAYVAAGLSRDDQIVLTRLSNPLENTLVEFSNKELIATNTN